MMDGIKALINVVHNKRIMSIRNVFIYDGEKLNFPPDLTLKLIIYSSARRAVGKRRRRNLFAEWQDI